MSSTVKEQTSLAQTVENNRNLIMGLNQTVASMGLEKVGHGAAGAIVTPATWVVDHKVNGNTPGFIDAALWAVGVAGAGAASTSVGLWKAIVDDATHQQYVEALSGEPVEYARHFLVCEKTSFNPPSIAAQLFAGKGGTAWQHKNGVWICARDASGKPIGDYRPKNFVVLYQPAKPLTRGSNGRFKFIIDRGVGR